MFEIIEQEEECGTIIKVFGVGGAGGNAIEHMIREGVNGVEFIAANTDAQALKRNTASSKLSLGKTGLGAGAKPEAGQAAAESHREEIFHMPVRLGNPKYAGSLSDVVQNPRFSTAYGLLLEAQAQRKRGQKIQEKQGIKDVFSSMKQWFSKNF